MERRVGFMGLLCLLMLCSSWAYATDGAAKEDGAGILDPWCGKYCMSIFTKTRTAKTVGKGHLSAAIKVQHFDWDEVKDADDDYHGRTSGQSKERLASTLCLKYGWAKNHHIAVGIPYWMNDFDIPGKENDHDGLANVFIFEKWSVLQETNTLPAVAFDLWYYFSTGDSDKKLGVDDGSIKVTTEISKAWKYFSLHVNPGYTWGLDDAPDICEFNAALLTTPCKTFWPACEYNYYEKKDTGHRHDLVPGIIWKFAPGWSFKAGAPITVDSTFTDKDRVGIVLKLFRRW